MIGLLLVLFISLYLVFGFFLYGYIRGWGPGKIKSLIITLVIMIGIPFGDVIPGKLYLYYICHKDGGIKINEVVRTSGYLALDSYSYGCGQGCIQRLREWQKLGKPMFIEAYVDNPREYNFVDKPGYYRFELVERTQDKCALYDSLRVKYPNRFSNFMLPDWYCISANTIESPISEYSIESWNRDYHVSDIMGVTADHAFIRRRSTGEIVASASQYTHRGGWLRRSIANAIAVGQPDQCPTNMTYALGSEIMRLTFN
jgi:hypothetical protein